jgi:hypothetical protein
LKYDQEIKITSLGETSFEIFLFLGKSGLQSVISFVRIFMQASDSVKPIIMYPFKNCSGSRLYCTVVTLILLMLNNYGTVDKVLNRSLELQIQISL